MKGSKGQGHIGVLMGGVSAEREISLRTGEAIMRGLRARGYAGSLIEGRNSKGRKEGGSGSSSSEGIM